MNIKNISCLFFLVLAASAVRANFEEEEVEFQKVKTQHIDKVYKGLFSANADHFKDVIAHEIQHIEADFNQYKENIDNCIPKKDQLGDLIEQLQSKIKCGIDEFLENHLKVCRIDDMAAAEDECLAKKIGDPQYSYKEKFTFYSAYHDLENINKCFTTGKNSVVDRRRATLNKSLRSTVDARIKSIRRTISKKLQDVEQYFKNEIKECNCKDCLIMKINDKIASTDGDFKLFTDVYNSRVKSLFFKQCLKFSRKALVSLVFPCDIINKCMYEITCTLKGSEKKEKCNDDDK